MLRLGIYLIAAFKLILLGKWYPPAHVRDVSASAYWELSERVGDIQEHLMDTMRQVEATRKKVYRDETRKDEETPVPLVTPKETAEASWTGLASLGPGDQVPPGILF